MRQCIIFFILALGIALGSPAHAVREYSGTSPSGAAWRIAVPDDWRAGGPLVLYQHGLNFAIDDDPSLGPLEDIALAQGYAIAASGFSQRGWALFRAIDDNRELLQIFRTQVGDPGELVPFGGSMGGLVALKLAEEPDFKPLVKGALALCPVVAASRAWDSGLDLRLAYDVVCDGVNAGELKEGAPPYPWAYNLNDIPQNLDYLEFDPDVRRALYNVTVCTGITLPESIRTNGMRQRLSRLQQFTGITDEKFLMTNIAYSTFVLSDVLRAPDKMGGRNPFGNTGAHYGDADMNLRIRRVDADPLAAVEFRWRSDFRGDVGTARILSLHTSDDQLVVPAHQHELRRRVGADQLVSAIVRETTPSHCGFSDREGAAAWEALRRWKDGGAKPTVASLQSGCLTVPMTGECRYDDSIVPPAMDSVVTPRPPVTPVIDGRFSGNWFDPSRNGEGIALEILDEHRALAYFFTYPPTGSPMAQAWMIGAGTIVPGGVAIDFMNHRPDVPGAAQAPLQHWGRLWISFTDCRTGSMRWEGPAGWGARSVPLTRLTGLQGLSCDAPVSGAPAQASGSWYDPAHNGSGFHVEQLDATHALVMYYGAQGSSPFSGWAVGVAEGSLAQGVEVPMVVPVGTHFGDAFSAAAITHLTDRVSLSLRLGCDAGNAVLRVSGQAPQTLPLTRLTRPAGTGACPSP
ncbi:hypothetical protein [Tahibacter amnicola]|uniref:Uncharacterized protein n=1 Tax=Tahibacter amnicola TaxID=2976241 RepID=A0ABY6BF54_9GAMM|nr:hypothetical protein [Tahibacter amnicola]UXI68445.1 hypothetical protein N4264_01980 [Tahibacter amnicola]